MNVVVTGVTGQIGRYLLEILSNDPVVEKVLGVWHKTEPTFRHEKVSYYYLPQILSQLDFLVELRNFKATHFINLGGITSIQASNAQCFIANVATIQAQLEMISLIGGCRYINAGSSLEGSNDTSPYTFSKRMAAVLIASYRDVLGAQPLIHNAESRYRSTDFLVGKVRDHLVKRKQSGHYLPLQLGDIFGTRDWSHAKDQAARIWKLSTLPEDEFKSLWRVSLGSGEAHSVKDLVEVAFKTVGIDGAWLGSNFISLDGEVLAEGGANPMRKPLQFFELGKQLGIREYSFESMVEDILTDNGKKI